MCQAEQRTTNGASQDRFKVGVQDNGPGILKKQIPLIFGKLLYGSKFHRLRMSRGQQGIGISAAGMYGLLTTGRPVKIMSKVSVRKPAHYYEIQIDTKRNQPEIINGRGDGVDVAPGARGLKAIEKHGINRVVVASCASRRRPHRDFAGAEGGQASVANRWTVREYDSWCCRSPRCCRWDVAFPRH